MKSLLQKCSKVVAMILMLQMILAAFSVPSEIHASTNDANLVTNPGFEDGLSGWDVSFSNTVAEITYDAASGAKALRVKASSQEQTVAVQPGKSYKLTFWGKITSGSAESN